MSFTMNPLYISNIQRRKPRRSMLGTHRPYGIGFQLNEPIAQINEKVSNIPLPHASLNIPHRPLRKSVIDTHAKRRNSIFSMLPDTSFNSPININVDDTAKKVDRANDSFEKNETFMMADVNEDEESVLANSFFDSTTAEMISAIPRLKNDTILSENANTVLDVTITMPKAEDSILIDLIDSLSLIIENNTRSVNRYHKQIDEIKNEREEKIRQTKDIIELKCRLEEKLNLDESPNETLTTKSPKQTESKPLEYSAIVPDQKNTIVSSSHADFLSQQVIHELRSTIKFLKTPRSSRCARQSIMLTPHSMSFSIKYQLEKLLE